MVGNASVIAGTLPSNNRDFILKALREGLRVDGRWLTDHRRIRIKLNTDGSTANVMMGETRVMTNVTYVLGKPQEGRPVDGVVKFFVKISPMAAPRAAEGGISGALSDAERELLRLLEQVYMGNRTIDREALCVIPGVKVWNLRVESTVLDAGGNLEDALIVATTVALRGLRLPHVEMQMDADNRPSVVVYPLEAKEPAMIHFQQQLYPVSFAVFEEDVVVVDPSMAEEAAAHARITVVLSLAHNIALFHKQGGLGMAFAGIQNVLQLAKEKVGVLAKHIDETLKTHQEKRDAAKIRRRGAPINVQMGRAIAVLPSQKVQVEPDGEEDSSEEDEEEGEGGEGEEERGQGEAEAAGRSDGAVPMDVDAHSGTTGHNAAALMAKPVKVASSGAKKRGRRGDAQGSWRKAAADRRKERDIEGGVDAAHLSALIAGATGDNPLPHSEDLASAVEQKKRSNAYGKDVT